MKKILIYGSKTFGSIIRNLAVACNYEFAGFIDDYAVPSDEIIGSLNYVTANYSPDEYVIANAIGYNHLEQRRQLHTEIIQRGFRTPALIHPQSYVDPTSRIDEGTFVMARAIIDYKAIIKDLVVVWPGAIVNHDSIIEQNVFLSPNSTICGCTTVGHDTFIGAGAVVVDHVHVRPGSFVKAGSVYHK